MSNSCLFSGDEQGVLLAMCATRSGLRVEQGSKPYAERTHGLQAGHVSPPAGVSDEGWCAASEPAKSDDASLLSQPWAFASRLFWVVVGLVSLALGILGIALPLLPTTPFLLLSAFCFARSSERLHRWLIDHHIFGPIIENWRTHRAIPRAAKIAATCLCIAGVVTSVLLNMPSTVLLVQVLATLCGLIVIWTCAEPG